MSRRNLSSLILKSTLSAALALVSACAAPRSTPVEELSSAFSRDSASTVDRKISAAPQTSATQSPAKFGILYALWHCRFKATPYNIREAIEGKASWGPVPAFHWWDKPDLGYYCLATDDEVLRQHAIWLRDAGIDFIVVDASNHAYTDQRSDDAKGMILDPLANLLRVWSQIEGAPRITIWAPLPADGDLLQAALQKFDRYPRMRFFYEDRPLVLTVHGQTDPGRLAELSQRATVRQMWGLLSSSSPGEIWSFMQPCADRTSFVNSGGTARCDQRVAKRNGVTEQIPAAAAYQISLISDRQSAVPKFAGQTLRSQMLTLREHSTAKIVLLNEWNEWIAQRFCSDNGPYGGLNCNVPDPSGAFHDHLPDGSKVFVDQYDHEYSRSIEPGGVYRSRIYDVMKQTISELKGCGSNCAPPPRETRQIAGIFGVRQGGGETYLDGWACASFDPSSIEVHLYVGAPAGSPGSQGVSAHRADLPSESAVEFECGLSNGSNTGRHRFKIPLSEDFLQRNQGKPLYVYGISPPSVNGPNLPLANSGVLKAPAPLRGQIIGLAGIELRDGVHRVEGWVCRNGDSNSLAVHVYAGGPAGSPGASPITGIVANEPSENGVEVECGTSSGPNSTGRHRFSFPLDSAWIQNNPGKPLVLHAIDGATNPIIGTVTVP